MHDARLALLLIIPYVCSTCVVRSRRLGGGASRPCDAGPRPLRRRQSQGLCPPRAGVSVHRRWAGNARTSNVGKSQSCMVSKWWLGGQGPDRHGQRVFWMRAEIPEDRLLWLTVLRRALEQVRPLRFRCIYPTVFLCFGLISKTCICALLNPHIFAGERCFPGYPPRQCRDRGQKRQQQQRR